jgi:alpha-glucoside transport system permease protein
MSTMPLTEMAPTGAALGMDPKKLTEPIGRSVAAALGSKPGKWAVYAIALMWTVPTFGILVSSFRAEKAVKTTGWWTVVTKPSLTLHNYSYVMNTKNGGDGLYKFLMNSFKITVPAVIISVGIAAIAAYALSWMDFKGRDWCFVAITLLLIVPLQMSLIPLSRLVYKGAHIGTMTIFPAFDFIKTSYAPLWIAHTCFGLPFCVYLLRNFMSGLPKEVMESARVDGAGHLTIFRKLVLPLSVPALASLGIYQFVYIWNDYLVATVFASTDKAPIVQQLVQISGSRGQSWHLLTAAAFISMVFPLVVFFSLQKYFVRGLLAGAVKG